MGNNVIPTIDRYTIYIKDLPKQFRDETRLRKFMNRLFPGKIAKVIIIPDVRELTRIQNEIKFHATALANLSKKHEWDMDDLYDDEKLPTIYEGTYFYVTFSFFLSLFVMSWNIFLYFFFFGVFCGK